MGNLYGTVYVCVRVCVRICVCISADMRMYVGTDVRAINVCLMSSLENTVVLQC